MKIVHICLRTFTDEMAYQENLLAKYHRKSGHHVTVLASTWKLESGSRLVETKQWDYINQDDIHVVRLPLQGRNDISRKFRKFKGLYEALCKESPDILFLHNLQYVDVAVITQYIKKHKVERVYVDNHADFSNSATNWLSKNILHKVIWRYYAHIIEPYTDKFYGVLPARVDFLIDMYKLPREKCKLLVMGADDDYVIDAKERLRHTREKYNINENDFLIVTGGKINKWKRQTVLLEEAFQKINLQNIRLIIFGSIDDELKDNIMKFCDERIQYVGWLSIEETYQIIAIADLAVYPGRHSTLWEQTVGQGIPIIVKHWEGTHHIDMDGNAEFLYQDSCEEMQQRIEKLLTYKDKYHAMKATAEKCAGQFLYSNIAKDSLNIECK